MGFVDRLEKLANDFIGKFGELWDTGVKKIAEGTKYVVKEFGFTMMNSFSGYFEALKFTEAVKDWMELNKEIYSTGRSLGMVADNMDAVTRNLSKYGATLSLYYSTDPKKMLQIMNEVAEATGRVRMMTNDEMEQLAFMEQFGGKKLVGSFDAVGGSVSVAAARFVQLQQNAGALGLNLNKATETLAKNMGKLNSLTFREGVTGMEKMVLLSQQMKLNFDAIENVASKFEKVEDAIANSAKLNMLGGSFAAEFSNPLEMMYYANYDAEGLMEKMNAALGGMGSFNTKTGIVDLSALDKKRIAAMAEATGMDKNAALEAANRKALARAMESDLTGKGFSQTEMDMITNRATWNAERGKFEVRMQDGSVMDIAKLQSGDITNMVSDHAEDATVDIRDNVRDIAQLLKVRMRDKSSRNMSWSDLSSAISGYATRKHFETMNSLFGGKAGGGANFIEMWRDRKEEKGIQNASVALDQLNGFDGVIKRALISNEGGMRGVFATEANWKMFGSTLKNAMEDWAKEDPYIPDGRSKQYDILDDLQKGKYHVPPKVTRPKDGSYSYSAPNVPFNFYAPSDTQRGYTVPFPVYTPPTAPSTPPNITPPTSGGGTPPPTVTPPTSTPSGSANPTAHTASFVQQPSSVASAAPSFSEMDKLRARSMTEEQAQELFKKVKEGKDVSSSDLNALKAYAFMQHEKEQNRTIDGHQTSMDFYMAKNKGDKKYADKDYAKEVTAFAQEVEGFVDITDPDLQNKAFLSVVKIHELLVAKYGSMSVVPHGATIQSQNQNIKGSTVKPLSPANNSLNVKTNSSYSSPMNGQMTVNFVVSGDLSLNGEKVGLSKEDIKRIVTSTDVVDAVMTKAQQLKGTQGSNIYETATWM